MNKSALGDPGRLRRSSRALLAHALSLALLSPALVLFGASPAAATDWTVEGENIPSTFDCDHLYYSNFRSGMQLTNGADGNATVENTVISKRKPPTNGLPDYWSTSMAMGKDPDTGKVAAFYANYTNSNLKLYKHVSGTDTVTDEIANGETRDLPRGTDWGGLSADPNRGLLYGAQNGGTPKIFQMDLASGAVQTWERGSATNPMVPDPADDPIFRSGTMVPDMFVDTNGGVYFGLVYGGRTHIYRLDPATGTVVRTVTVNGPGSSNGFSNYGMAYLNGYIYLGYVGGTLYQVDPSTGTSTTVPGGTVQTNQTGRIQSESGGSWPITDLASCAVSPDFTNQVVIKKSSTPAKVTPGGKVTYSLTVTNEGTAPASQTRVTDDLSQILDDASYNDDATATSTSGSVPQPVYDAAGKKVTWTGDLAPGETVTLTYSVTVAEDPQGDKVLRNAVVGPDESNCPPGSDNPDCSTVTPVESLAITKRADKTTVKPGDQITYTVTVENTGGGPYPGATFTDDLSAVLDDASWDDVVTRSTGTASFDPAAESLTWTGDLAKGETATVTYRVTVGEPPAGDKRLKNAVLGPDGSNCPPDSTDPDCSTDVPVKALVVKKTATPDNPRIGDQVTYTVTMTNVGGAPYPGAEFTDDLSGVLDDATWDNDVSRTKGDTRFDAAGETLTWTGDLAVGETVTVTYKVTVTRGGDKYLRNTVTADDSPCIPGTKDPDCSTVLPKPELQIKKSSSPADPLPGDTVTYTVTVANTGTADYSGATFTDDLTGVLDDATWDDAVTETTGDSSFDAGAQKLSWTGDVAQGDTETITYTVTVGTPPEGDKILKNAVVGPDDSTCPPDSTDPDCSTDTPVPALEIKKTSSPSEPRAGDTVTYTVTVANTGAADYVDATFTDDLTGVLDDATWGDELTETTGAAQYSEPKVEWTGTVVKGGTATITYTVQINNPPEGDKVLKNAVVGPDGSNCPPDSTDPDCSKETPLPFLELEKTSDKATARPGDTVTYTVTVTNTGEADYHGAKFADDLGNILDDAEWADTVTKTSGTTSYAAPTFSWTGDVAKGATVTVTYQVTVNKPPTGDLRLDNTVIGPDDSTCPPDSTDPDCSTDVGIRALKIVKSGTPKDVETGDTVTYTIKVTNIGTVDYPGATFSDDLTGVLDDATWNGDERADAGTAAFAAPTLSWTGNLSAGETATVTYTVTVTNAGDKQLSNTVTGPDSNCDPDSDDPDCTEDIPSPQLEIKKTSRPAKTTAGGTVSYTITVRNAGRQAYKAASYADDLTGVLDDAAYNGDAKASSGSVGYAEPMLTWKGDVAAGATVTVTYSVKVFDPLKGDKVLRNAVTGPSGSNCPPPTTRAASEADCRTETPVQQLTLSKTATPKRVKPGGTVTYTVTATNTGATAIDNAGFTDDLSGVLAHAAYNRDANGSRGTATVTGTRLEWLDETGRTLEAGERVTVTYSVRVKKGAEGKKPVNFVTSTTPGTTCADERPLPCGTTVTTTGRLTVVKKDTKDGRPLSGAVFQLWRETNGTPGLQRSDTRTGPDCATDRGGRCTFRDLPNGTYYLKETAVPEGYALPRNVVSGPYKITDRSATPTITLTNRRGGPCDKDGPCQK